MSWRVMLSVPHDTRPSKQWTGGRSYAFMARVVLVIMVAVLSTATIAAPSPFGIATPDGSGGAFGGPLAPLFQWIAIRQSEFYRTLTGALGDLKENGSATWLLMAVSFAYGVFHAAGPGHGKAVISAYVLSSGENVRRGVMLSFASAFVQALSAIAVVMIGAIMLGVTAQSMTTATEWIEIASYALIALVGGWLLFAKITGRDHHHHHHDNRPHAHEHDDYHHDAPLRSGFPSALSAVLAVGIRPCSGAIIILVFALAQGLLLAGVAATFVMAVGTGLTVAFLATLAVSARGLALRLAGSGAKNIPSAIKAVEIFAALAILVFGLLMLGGALTTAWSQRMA